MPFDFLSSLRRLEGNLKRKLAGRPRTARRWILVLALAPLLSVAAYIGAARWLLSGPRLRALINADAASLSLDYDEATSFWPGRLAIRNLRLRGSDQNVQWIIRLDSARLDYSILALARRTFQVKRLRGTGLSFFLRNKLEPADLKATDASVLPAVPGFADPPLRSAQIQDTAQEGDPWRIDVRTLFIDHFDDIWVDAFHYRGGARLEGGFFLRPGLLARIGPARIDFESGELRIGNAPTGIGVSGTVAGEFEPFAPPRVHGSEVWQKVSGEVTLDARFERFESLEYLVRSAAGARLEDGAGRATVRAAIEHGIARGEIGVALHDGSVRLKKLRLRGEADLRLLIPRWNLTSGPLDVSGSRLALSDVRSSGSDESRRWWGRFDIRSGTIGSTTSAKIKATTRDAQPLLALFAVDLPVWTRGLVNLDDFTATATVDMGPSVTRVRGLDARGGSFHIQGHYLRQKANREGAFLIESGALSLGLELGQNATKIRLLDAKRWFDEQPDGRSASRNMMPPSDAAATPRTFSGPAQSGAVWVRLPAGFRNRSAGRFLPAFENPGCRGERPGRPAPHRVQFPRTLNQASCPVLNSAANSSAASR